jgi:rhamnopyranosyl-N-acetylglucosaminyl-diphospho-decaprenol beta-1,3/1,4-galactofuranosyltransferase
LSICAVIVTYNRVEKLKETLKAYLTSCVDSFVIVNNASTDGTEAFLDCFKADHQCRVIHSTTNTGGAGGFYLALKEARLIKDVDWLVVSDDDSYPEAEAINFFKDYVINQLNVTDLIAASVYFPDGAICPMNQPMALLSVKQFFYNVFHRRKLTGIQNEAYLNNQSSSIAASSFVGMFINHASLLKSNVLPDPNYFIYWDDISFCLDMKKAGYTISFVPQVRFIHDCSRNTNNLSKERLYFMVRNGVRTINKLPIHIKFFALFIKLIRWLFVAIQNKSIKWYFKAIKDA